MSTVQSTSTNWTNWSGLESATDLEVVQPSGAAEISEVVRRARDAGRTVKTAGTGHSFTGIATPHHVHLRPERMRGIIAVDRDAMTVTALAGTQLKVFNAELAALGLSLHNMGDIAEQTLAGAVSTGTHGTGGRAAGLGAQVVGVELVTGT
ncbi:MAG TPA: FAD-binding protein, partial [Acidimicrobiales bacterium]